MSQCELDDFDPDSVFSPMPVEPDFAFSRYCEEMCEKAPDKSNVYLDLRNVDFLSGSDIAYLLKARTALSNKGQHLYVLNPSEIVMMSLKNCRMDRLLQSCCGQGKGTPA